ncbi:uncharacterized protein LOC100180981 isoform X1 [Ciona intestinalis]
MRERLKLYLRGLIIQLMIFMLLRGITAQRNIPGCGADMATKQGVITSPGYNRNYQNNLECIWNVQFKNTDQIAFYVRDLVMENGQCLKDYIEITFSDKKAPRVCGFRPPRRPIVGAGPATVKFVSNGGVSYRGFYIQYAVTEGVLKPPDPCASNPCQNGGTCTTQGSKYVCTCVDGFAGTDCETVVESSTVDHCDPNPCQNDGTCTDTGDGYSCACADGWTGDTCAEDIDECAPNPCLNDGTCENGMNQFTCSCVSGFTDTTCSTNIDECGSSPCQNGGECTDDVNMFTCTCQPGWTGDLCQEDIDECSSDPCLNGGECENGQNQFTCSCKDGYSGDTCEIEPDKDYCSPNPCRNGGSCTNKKDGFDCKCAPGFRGLTCVQDVDECASNPCLNGGRCRNNRNSYSCQCQDGYTGSRCENAPVTIEEGDPDDICNPNPCMNEGECHDLGDGEPFCFCQDGFEGDLCEEGENNCIPNPCENSGTCVLWGESFTCTCARGFEGETCSKDIDECASNPCEGDLVCVDKPNAYVCRMECDPGYTGEFCDVEIDECDPNPCLNGATCIDELAAYQCTCVAGFNGTDCEYEAPCSSSPCENSGSCEQIKRSNTTSYRCLCNIGWAGVNCQTKVSSGCSNPHGGAGFIPFGASLEISCEVGFVLTGSERVTCLDSGEFDGPIPQCILNGTSPSAVGKGGKLKMSPLVISMMAAGGVVVAAIGGFLSYVFIFAPWNAPAVKAKIAASTAKAGKPALSKGADTSLAKKIVKAKSAKIDAQPLKTKK